MLRGRTNEQTQDECGSGGQRREGGEARRNPAVGLIDVGSDRGRAARRAEDGPSRMSKMKDVRRGSRCAWLQS